MEVKEERTTTEKKYILTQKEFKEKLGISKNEKLSSVYINRLCEDGDIDISTSENKEE